jgi:hypothetical protein
MEVLLQTAVGIPQGAPKLFTTDMAQKCLLVLMVNTNTATIPISPLTCLSQGGDAPISSTHALLLSSWAQGSQLARRAPRAHPSHEVLFSVWTLNHFCWSYKEDSAYVA